MNCDIITTTQYKLYGKVTKEETNTKRYKIVNKDPNKLYAEVGTDRRVTINRGDFNSVSFTVSLRMPCEVNEDAIKETYEEIATFCEKEIGALTKKVKAVK
jgi:hypothetical protein